MAIKVTVIYPSIIITCPICRKSFNIPKEGLTGGKHPVSCPYCKARLAWEEVEDDSKLNR